MYNYVRGELQDVGGNNLTNLTVTFYRGTTDGPTTGITGSTVTGAAVTHLTATRHSKGI